MRAHRFVAYFGSAVATAGQAVAEAAHVEYDHRGGLAAQDADTPSERVGHELLRQIARELDATERGEVTFTGRALAPVRPEKRATPTPGGDLGILFQVDIPGYSTSTALIAKSVYAPAMDAGTEEIDGAALRDRLHAQIETSPSMYLLLVEDAGVRVVAGQAVAGITDPITRTAVRERVYAKSLGRFAQEFAEGFLGDPSLAAGFRYPDGSEDLDHELRTWAAEHDLQGAVLIRVTRSPNREPSSLRDFY